MKVCPYYKLGCRVSCRRSSVAGHLKACTYAVEMAGAAEAWDSGRDEVVCLYSKFGCTFSGTLCDVKEHILNCSQRGLTQLEEMEERRVLKKHVIEECEEERIRRLLSPTNRRRSISLSPLSLTHTLTLSLFFCMPE